MCIQQPWKASWLKNVQYYINNMLLKQFMFIINARTPLFPMNFATFFIFERTISSINSRNLTF